MSELEPGFNPEELELEKKDNEQNINSESILTQGDKKNLYESGRIVIEQILKDFPDSLPDVVLLPDTAARPLAYLLEPALTKAAADRHMAKPLYIFFKTQHGEIHMFSRFADEYETDDISEAFQKYKTDTLQDIAESPRRSPFRDTRLDLIDSYEKMLPNALAMDGAFRRRIDEIKSKIKKSDAHFIAVDDYVSDSAFTLHTIKRVTGNDTKLYALMTSSEHIRGDDVNYGIVDSSEDVSAGFDYRRNKNTNELDTPIGVIKDEDFENNPYTRPNNASYADKNELRTEMREIGQAIANEI